MEPIILEEELTLVGIEAVVDMTGPFGEAVDALWSAMADRAGEVACKVDPAVWVGYWFMPEGAGPNQSGYMAAVAVRQPGVEPRGMVSKALPRSAFAVFPEEQRGTVGGPGGYAYSTWLPASPFEFHTEVNGDLEVYQAPPCGPFGSCEIWIPVRRKE